MKRIWPAVLLSLALAACESPTSWGKELVIESQPVLAAADSATVQGAAGGMVVHGVYRAPGTGYTLRAWYDFVGDAVTVYVEGRLPADGATREALTGTGYRISIPFSPGSYTVRVMHRDDGAPAPREVATAAITIGYN
ncbi:MAG TPA: hypothetical protein VE871_07345 [Longimicrobium sp.]|nr:hypothetical protein [Longimicrobium sp.]